MGHQLIGQIIPVVTGADGALIARHIITLITVDGLRKKNKCAILAPIEKLSLMENGCA
jgi:hypothetical protein